MKNKTKLVNSIVTGQFEILDYIDTESKSMPFESINNEKLKKFRIDLNEKLKTQYIFESIAYFENDKFNISKLGNLKEFQKNILKRGLYSESFLCFITYQILNGLEYCHKRNIAHFDIKPENIIIDEYLNIKLSDFSLGLDYSKNKSSKIELPLVGTHFYMAPEVLSHKKIDLKDLNKVDLYSLGVTIFNLAFGYYPYSLNDNDNELIDFEKSLKKIENESLGLVNSEGTNSFSFYFKDFLKNLLEKDIKKRININEALEHYWIKGVKILNDEKENLDDSKKFLENLIYNNLIKFNKYMNNKV